MKKNLKNRTVGVTAKTLYIRRCGSEQKNLDLSDEQAFPVRHYLTGKFTVRYI